MAAEDAVVDVMMKLVMTGVDVGLKISGAGAKALGVSLYALAKSIRDKQASGKTLSPGEVAFTNLIKSGEEIHSVWLNKSELDNFSQIAKKLGISFVAIQNGDELTKSKNFINKNSDKIEFTDEFKDKVSISYRSSDEVRMAHILQMFNTFNPSVIENAEEQSVNVEIKDEIEEFIKDNGVENELPPEIVDYEEVKMTEQSQALNNGLMNQGQETINLKQKDLEYSDGQVPLCFTFFEFDSVPNKSELSQAYNTYVLKNDINIDEPNFVTALYEQGCKFIDKSEPALDCFKYFGLSNGSTVDELKASYNEKLSGKANVGTATEMYKKALGILEQSESVRTTLQAKKELRNVAETGRDSIEKVAQITQEITRQ